MKPYWVASNSLLLLAIYFATIENVKWLQPIVISFVWLLVFVYGLMQFQKKPSPTKTANGAPQWAYHLVDFCVLAALLYAEWYVTASAYAFSCVLLQSYHAKQKSLEHEVKT